MDNNKDAVYIQQLRKYCKDNKKWNEIFPVTFIQAIYNAATVVAKLPLYSTKIELYIANKVSNLFPFAALYIA